MVRAENDLIVTFNGEIYNYRALREALIEAGYRFQSDCDTEVLLHLYAQKGAGMLTELRGMFAFAIWDARKQELFLARDTFGIKPLYYSDERGTFRFASSVKALLAGGTISRELDLAGQAGFYLFGSVPEPFTTYRAISCLPAGSWLKLGARGVQEPVVFQAISHIFQEAEQEAASLPEEGLRERAQAAFLDSVRHHLVADVPVGAFLSGGVDSGALVGLMRDAGASDIQTLTLSFDEFQGRDDDEAPLAAELARLYGTTHSTRIVTGREFRDDLPKILDAMDQPSMEAVNSWFVSKAVRELGMKVAISGLGGDELLGGYPSFSDVLDWKRKLRLISKVPGVGVGLRHLSRRLLGHTRLPRKAFSMVEFGGTLEGAYLLRRGLFMPWELNQLMGPDAARQGLERLDPLNHVLARRCSSVRSGFAQVSMLELSIYMRNQTLRDVDWTSMAHGLEVRVPLIDIVLLKTIAPIMIRLGKALGKELLAEAPAKPLPKLFVDRKKTGFGIPVGRWAGLKVNGNIAYGHSRPWAEAIFAHHSGEQELTL